MTARPGVPSAGARRKRRPTRVLGAVLAGVLVGASAVTGCSVRVMDAGSSGSPTTPVPTDPAPTDRTPASARPGPTTDPGTVTDEGTGARPARTGGDAAGAVLDRAGLRTEVTRTGACGPDVVVEQAGAGVELTGDCGTLTVLGADARVVAGRVEHLVVRGGGAQVVVASATEVTIDAAGVRVAWEDGDARVTVTGADARYGPVGTVHPG